MIDLPSGLAEFQPGWVWLVGAGPGDPGLLSVLGLHGMRYADVIVYDALVSPDVLGMAPPEARLECAGKRGGRPSARQPDISRRLVMLAGQGLRVLRLKGGDPFVFGRGGEETSALIAAGVPFRLVPGITAAVGGLAYAGIPGGFAAVTLLTGHDARGGVPSSLNWTALANVGQPLVFYMALSHLEEIVERLVEAGCTEGMPVVVISRATTPKQRVIIATLRSCIADVAAGKVTPPAIFAVGEAMRTRKALAWFPPVCDEPNNG